MQDQVVAQAPVTLNRTILQTVEIPAGDTEAVMARSELGPDRTTAPHSHPGPEIGYVLEGSGGILIEGRAPMILNAGQSYQLPGGIPHALQAGPRGIKVIVTWAKPKGQPLAFEPD